MIISRQKVPYLTIGEKKEALIGNGGREGQWRKRGRNGKALVKGNILLYTVYYHFLWDAECNNLPVLRATVLRMHSCRFVALQYSTYTADGLAT